MPPIDLIEGFADWVIAELKGVGRYHLLGHSMGGMIAQEIARKDAAKIDKLILYCTGPLGNIPGRFETMAQSKARARADGAEATARRIAANWFFQGAHSPAYPVCADLAAKAQLPAIIGGLDAMQAWSGRDSLPEIDQETLILWGDADRAYSWEQTQILWSEIPRTQLAVLPNCGHALHMEKPDLFAQVVRDFLMPRRSRQPRDPA